MELSSIVISVIFLLLTTLLLKSIVSIKNQRGRNPPGPLGLPIIGHFHLLSATLHHSLHELSCRYGPLFQIRLGSMPCFVASTSEVARAFLKKNELKFSSREDSSAIRILSYDSSFAFAPYGHYWKFMKKLLTSELLGARTINRFRPVRALETQRQLKHLMNGAKIGETVNLTAELLTLTNNVISQMMLGKRFSENEESAKAMRTVIREVTQIFGEFNISDVLWFCRNWDLQGIEKRSHDIHKRYDELLEKIITDRELQRRCKKMETNLEGDSDEAESLLDILFDVMENENSEVKLTRQHIKALFLDLLTAGTDSTAISIEWALVELIRNPNVLKKAQEEINKVVGSNRLVEETDAPNLPYMHAIVKETFRLHPPIPIVIRRSVEECTVDGYHIPTDVLLLTNVWSIGRNPNIWSSPLEFTPERFFEPTTGEKQSSIDVRGEHFELLPFGTGRRGCPGMSLAIQEVPAVLAALIQCFDFVLLDLHGQKTNVVDMTERPGITAPRAHDLVCILVPRNVAPTILSYS
uniref:Flavone synthase n=1 Tax=Nemophila menziesii TaxID=79376 RepID=A0A292GEN6_NEMME|nr:flavone synthase [Nemophila menziesii]